jgi:hypothetical protein
VLQELIWDLKTGLDMGKCKCTYNLFLSLRISL